MWTTEHSVETTASAESVWRLWSDVTTWGDWNADIERIEISGPFAPASTIAMTPVGQDIVELRIAEASEPDLFVDEADLGEVVVRTKSRGGACSPARGAALSRTSSRVLSRRPGPIRP
jgi:hypothetical protein